MESDETKVLQNCISLQTKSNTILSSEIASSIIIADQTTGNCKSSAGEQGKINMINKSDPIQSTCNRRGLKRKIDDLQINEYVSINYEKSSTSEIQQINERTIAAGENKLGEDVNNCSSSSETMKYLLNGDNTTLATDNSSKYTEILGPVVNAEAHNSGLKEKIYPSKTNVTCPLVDTKISSNSSDILQSWIKGSAQDITTCEVQLPDNEALEATTCKTNDANNSEPSTKNYNINFQSRIIEGSNSSNDNETSNSDDTCSSGDNSEGNEDKNTSQNGDKIFSCTNFSKCSQNIEFENNKSNLGKSATSINKDLKNSLKNTVNDTTNNNNTSSNNRNVLGDSNNASAKSHTRSLLSGNRKVYGLRPRSAMRRLWSNTSKERSAPVSADVSNDQIKEEDVPETPIKQHKTSNCGSRTRTPRSKPLSKYRRITANARERDRMKEINTAFTTLRAALPTFTNCRISSMTKYTTLQLAASYIRGLSELLQESPSNSNSNKKENRPNLCGSANGSSNRHDINLSVDISEIPQVSQRDKKVDYNIYSTSINSPNTYSNMSDNTLESMSDIDTLNDMCWTLDFMLE